MTTFLLSEAQVDALVYSVGAIIAGVCLLEVGYRIDQAITRWNARNSAKLDTQNRRRVGL